MEQLIQVPAQNPAHSLVQVFDYNSNAIEFETINGEIYANATAMCSAFGKEVRHWAQLKSVNAYIEALSKRKENLHLDFVLTTRGSGGGTWIHERLILKLAQWLDIDFEIWCDEMIMKLHKNGVVAIRQPSAPLSNLDFMQMALDQMKAQENRIASVEDKVLRIEAQSKQRPDYFTIVGYASLQKMNMGIKLASSIGKKAAAYCKANNIEMESLPDPRFGVVRTYPETVLSQIFNQTIL